MHESALGIHQIELVVEARPDLGDGRGVGEHEDRALDLGKVTARDDGRRLVVDANLEAGRAPVDKLDRALGLDRGDGGVDVLGDDVTAVQDAAGHVLAVARVALDHGRGRLEHGVGDLSNRQLLVVGLLGRDDRGVGAEREVDTRVRDQVRLELGEIDVEGTVEAEGRRHRGDELGDQTVQVRVRRALDVEVAAADVIKRLVVDEEGAVSVLEHGVSRQNAVVRLDDGRGDLRARVDDKVELGLLAIVNRQALEEEGAEAGARSAAEGVEDEEALEASALVSELADPVKDEIDDLLADRVVAASVVVGGILLAGDELLRVEELAVRARADLVDGRRLKVDVDGAGDVLAGTSLREEGVEGVVAIADSLVRRHLAVRLDAVLQAVELPAGVGRDAKSEKKSWRSFRRRPDLAAPVAARGPPGPRTSVILCMHSVNTSGVHIVQEETGRKTAGGPPGGRRRHLRAQICADGLAARGTSGGAYQAFPVWTPA